ncbi:NAD(P)-dependent oxidoreductase [Pseudomonas sp. PB103]|uniref:NAD(P)-dependent oxidoreductase n=1 Tax=Pseudomonas sp. PB103 TaxID=2494698 RepID=UPI00131D7811|nr:NAD(P)-dependent oxidoreductase [Pseudomonas sp. PB103]KAE9646801.1 NAD(P)-dependent oxidoreductase [Pseudomonas sp. PB103]
MELGFIGLGTMGVPMVLNLLKAGHQVRVWNRSAAPLQALVNAGAEAVDSPALAARAEVLISMLGDDAAIRAVFLDAHAIDGLAPGSVHVNMSTVSVALAREMAALHKAHGVAYVSAPVLGRVDVAAAGNLNILASGDAEALARVQPLFDVLGRKTWPFGEDAERACVAKLSANLMIAAAIESTAEASTLANGYGISRADFIEMITSTLFAVPVYQGYGKLMVDKQFEPAGFKLSLGLKDVRLALEAGEAAHVPLPFASVLKDNLLDGMAHGQADQDWASLSQVSDRRAGSK